MDSTELSDALPSATDAVVGVILPWAGTVVGELADNNRLEPESSARTERSSGLMNATVRPRFRNRWVEAADKKIARVLPSTTWRWFRAASSGHVWMLRMMILRRTVKLNAIGGPGLTALYCAAAGGHLEAVELLLEAGADSSIREAERGHTPLHAAAYGGHVEVVRRLLLAGASLEARDYNCCTAAGLAQLDGGGIEWRKAECVSLLRAWPYATVGRPVLVRRGEPTEANLWYYFPQEASMACCRD